MSSPGSANWITGAGWWCSRRRAVLAPYRLRSATRRCCSLSPRASDSPGCYQDSDGLEVDAIVGLLDVIACGDGPLEKSFDTCGLRGVCGPCAENEGEIRRCGKGSLGRSGLPAPCKSEHTLRQTGTSFRVYS